MIFLISEMIFFNSEMIFFNCRLNIKYFIWCRRKNFKLLFSALIILTVVVSSSYFSPNEDDLSHSARMTFPGNIKGGENARSSSPHIFFEQDELILLFSLTPAADHITMRRAHPIYGSLFSSKSFLQHLFIPPRPTDPRSFKLDVLFLLWPKHQLNSCSVFNN